MSATTARLLYWTPRILGILFAFFLYLGIAGPLLVTGLLFLANWRHRDELRQS